MASTLAVEEGDLKGLVLSFESGEHWIVGRDPDACQWILEDPLVSRKHLLLTRTAEGITLKNLSATNPVQVNDQEIGDTLYLLKGGDSVKLGHQTLRFSTHPDPEKLEASEPDENDEPPPLPKEENGRGDFPSEDTIFEEEELELARLAEIDFSVVEMGRWLLKVVNGPNNGAEFYMQAGRRYVLGTDPKICDIVFHDTSVSRQHACITITPEDTLTIEDLKSRNGVLVEGGAIERRQPLPTNTIVTLGTTSFVVYDREGEMQTIISPLLPSIVKVLQGESSSKEEASAPATSHPESPATPPPPLTPAAPPPSTREPPPPKTSRHVGPYLVLTAIIGLFALAGIGTSALFKSEPVSIKSQVNADELIKQALKPFPSVRYTFNPTTGKLLLIGHVTSLSEKSQLLYALQGLKFIKSPPDDTGLVIDEYVWQEINSILADNPAWQGVSVYSPAAGEFVLSGYLRTRKQADQLSSFISLNFPYLDLLKKQVVVEEEVLEQIKGWLQKGQLPDVIPTMHNSEVSLNGTAPAQSTETLSRIVDEIKQIPGVRAVNVLVRPQTAETGLINLSSRYHVTGKSRVGNKYTVVINGHLLSQNDELDGMTITKITRDHLLLEKGDEKYRIDY